MTEVYRGRKITFCIEEQTLPNGKVMKFDLVRHPGAVIILPQANDGTLYLLRQYRPALGVSILEFPAGTLEAGEDPAECARRELEEEIGMAASEWRSLGMLYPAPGFCDEKQYCYFAKGLFPKKQDCDEDEILEPLTLSVARIEELIKQGELLDGKSLAILLKARIQGLL